MVKGAETPDFQVSSFAENEVNQQVGEVMGSVKSCEECTWEKMNVDDVFFPTKSFLQILGT